MIRNLTHFRFTYTYRRECKHRYAHHHRRRIKERENNSTSAHNNHNNDNNTCVEKTIEQFHLNFMQRRMKKTNKKSIGCSAPCGVSGCNVLKKSQRSRNEGVRVYECVCVCVNATARSQVEVDDEECLVCNLTALPCTHHAHTDSRSLALTCALCAYR